MSRFNEERNWTGPRPWQALLAVALSMLLLASVGGALEPAKMRYWRIVLTELLCLGLPGLALSMACRGDPVRLLRLRLPRPGLVPDLLLMGGGGFVLAQSGGVWMERLLGPEWAPDLQRLVPHGGAGTLAALLALSLSPAVIEELFYRGYVLRGIENTGAGAVGASAIVGFLFAAAHMSPVLFPSLLFLGTAITFVVIRADSMPAGMILHALNNGLTVILWNSPTLAALPGSFVANAAAAAVFTAGLVGFARRTSR